MLCVFFTVCVFYFIYVSLNVFFLFACLFVLFFFFVFFFFVFFFALFSFICVLIYLHIFDPFNYKYNTTSGFQNRSLCLSNLSHCRLCLCLLGKKLLKKTINK